MSSEKNSTRDRILRATWKLLEGGTGSAVRMSDIAKSAKISRQALYLHFPNRAELLVATTRYLDEYYDIQGQLTASRAATNAEARLQEWISVWGNYIPKIYGIGKALMAMKDTDAETAAAWDDRMQAVREGSAAAVNALASEELLTPDLTQEEGTDVLWSLQSVRMWEHLCLDSGWSQERYIDVIHMMARNSLLKSVPK